MKRMLKILSAAGVILLFTVSGIWAQQAVIQDMTGTVEIKTPNSSAWVPAQKGQTLVGDTIISTGFRSTALVAIGNSVLTVRPITRLTLKELSLMQDSEKIELNLQIGRVRADVKAPPSGRTDFTIQAPTATASVRGTVFEFDTLNLSVSEGTVDFMGATGESVVVDAGRASFADEGSGRAISPQEFVTMRLRPDIPIATQPIQASDKAAQGASDGNLVDLSATIHF